MKIHWMSWGTLTRAKKEGGYDFRELLDFISAMLANMVARVLREPNALWVRVLKGIYFPNKEFMRDNPGSRESWGWVRLLKGRDVLKEKRYM